MGGRPVEVKGREGLEWGEPTPESRIDKVMGGCVHEGGHVFALHEMGVKMTMVRIRRKYFNRLGVVGGTGIDDSYEVPDPGSPRMRQLLMAVMAGMVAHDYWLVREHCWSPKRAKEFSDIGGGGDRPLFEWLAHGSNYSMTQARLDVLPLVRRDWLRITRGAFCLRRYQDVKAKQFVRAGGGR